jgi:uncharacterized membrane protein
MRKLRRKLKIKIPVDVKKVGSSFFNIMGYSLKKKFMILDIFLGLLTYITWCALATRLFRYSTVSVFP